MFEAVLFDMDGVIIDTDKSVSDFWYALAAEHNITLTLEDFTQHIYGTQAAYTLDHLFAMLTLVQREEVGKRIVEYEKKLYYESVPGVVDFIAALKHHTIPVALVTSGEQHKYEAVAAQLNLSFDAVVTAESVRNGKPAPDCYQLGARLLGKRPEQCLVFEDSNSGSRAAIAAGATCIGVGHAEAILRANGAVDVIGDFTECRVLPDKSLYISPRFSCALV